MLLDLIQFLIITLISLLTLLFLWLKLNNNNSLNNNNKIKSITLIVLGDISRSPRMLFHSKSLIENNFITYIFAYKGSNLPKILINSPNVHLIYLPTPMPWLSKMSRPFFILLSPLKVLVMTFTLLYALLFRIPFTTFMLIQNPPAIPTLPIVQFAGWLRGSKIIIDWHNTGWSVLALRVGEQSLAVKIAKWIEITFGRKAFAHLCVTEAMRKNLIRDANLKGKTVVFHDRPPSNFRKQTVSESHDLFSRLPVFSSKSITNFFETSSSFNPHDTIFTSSSTEGVPTLLSNRPALIVSSTSWTADEDFSILLKALDLYEIKASSSTSPSSLLPKLMIVITGKGNLKESFELEVKEKELNWNFVRVKTTWLELDDYPKLLGSADLGISLHASTSGADLPMKVVDMFGCGLPVCALTFACVDELVKDKINGRTFKTSLELCDQLISLLSDFTSANSELNSLREGITSTKYGEEQEEWSNWENNWKKIVEPLLT